ncbi:MAG TPA: hypothetical protein VFY44_08130 [Thermoleophilaceae bacterium]|nr:hypothetical protein [Thermoleophilaceae bacterium]
MSATPALSMLLLCAALALPGCGGEGDDDPGQKELLGDATFQQAVRAVGVSPATRPVSGLGRAIGVRMRDLTAAERRLAAGSLSRQRFRRRYGQGPLEMCDRLGALVGQLDSRLDPDAELSKAVVAGFGRGGSVKNELSARLPGSESLECAMKYRSSYVFVARLYRD